MNSLIDGVVVIDKPAGWTSNDVVQKVKGLFQVRKAGHTGTLDPIATGVLPVCLNKATQLSYDLMCGDKEYEVEILFGVETTTYDTEGEVVAQKEVPSNLENKILIHLPKFLGVVQQKVPYFSAIKFEGRPLYYWARQGRLIDLPPRPVEIKHFEIKNIGENTITARIVCTKGTYIRSICHDLGKLLGCGATMKGLRRLATGPFSIKDATTIGEIEGFSTFGERMKYVVPIAELPDLYRQIAAKNNTLQING